MQHERDDNKAFLCREVNDEIGGLSSSFHSGDAEFLCECANASCSRRLLLTLAEYETVRRHPGRFVLVSGHELPDDHVVERHDRYVVTETEPDERTGPAERRSRLGGLGFSAG
jgi:hypothetical protein